MHLLTARLASLFLCCAVLTACSPAPQSGRPTGADFLLQGPAGPVDSHAFRGKLMLVFFGYVHCPDVCPTSLAAMNEVLSGMTPEERAKIQPVLISVDPARDTPESLKNYAAYFHPSLIGVTGTPEQIATIAKAFGAGYVRQPPRSDGSYAVDHSANTYLVGKDGKLAATLPYGAPADDLRAAIRKAL
jgi:protein SCO1/2